MYIFESQEGYTKGFINGREVKTILNIWIPFDKEELPMSRAMTKNLVRSIDTVGTKDGGFVFESETPILKIFVEGAMIGLENKLSYYSFFFKIDHASDVYYTIKPFRDFNYYFKARGRFLSSSNIDDLYDRSSLTYKFYKRQMLPTSVIRSIVKKEIIGQKVRNIILNRRR